MRRRACPEAIHVHAPSGRRPGQAACPASSPRRRSCGRPRGRMSPRAKVLIRGSKRGVVSGMKGCGMRSEGMPDNNSLTSPSAPPKATEATPRVWPPCKIETVYTVEKTGEGVVHETSRARALSLILRPSDARGWQALRTPPTCRRARCGSRPGCQSVRLRRAHRHCAYPFCARVGVDMDKVSGSKKGHGGGRLLCRSCCYWRGGTFCEALEINVKASKGRWGW